MRKVFLIILLQTFIISVCAQLKKDTAMVEKYDFEITENGSKGALIQKGDWLIEIWSKPSMIHP